MGDKEKLSVGGYLFTTEKDAELAEAEMKKIEYIEARMDYTQPCKLLVVYRRLLQERVFRTPVGFGYLMKLRGFLLTAEEIAGHQEVPEIPVYQNFSGEIRDLPNEIKTVAVPKKREDKKRKDKLFISVTLNCMLVLAVVAMFIIALKSDTPNMINYRNAITNRYSAWEQELKNREEAVREKEKELFEQKWKE